MAGLTSAVSERLEQIRARIAAAGGDPAGVRIVAVTKGFGPEAVQAAIAAGCREIGESYAQELLGKQAMLAASPARIHFVGGIQRNKIARLAPIVQMWQSVDRVEVGRAIARHAPGASVLVQIDLLGGTLPGRAGVTLTAAPALVEALRSEGLKVAGFMAVGPPPPADPEPGFRLVAAARRDLGLPVLSLGMSGDLEAAVRAGTTMVRVGTALFGPRPKARKT